MPLIRDYVAEHERATNLGGDAVRAIDRGELAEARALLAGPLVQEHRDLQALLATVDLSDSADQGRVRTAVFELHEHIAKEEDGLFPASLIALDGDEWDASMLAWHEAHPGDAMIGE